MESWRKDSDVIATGYRISLLSGFGTYRGVVNRCTDIHFSAAGFARKLYFHPDA